MLLILTLPPCTGFSRFDIVRVGESPSTWGLRLLVNSAVIGRMESGQAALEVRVVGEWVKVYSQSALLKARYGWRRRGLCACTYRFACAREGDFGW